MAYGRGRYGRGRYKQNGAEAAVIFDGTLKRFNKYTGKSEAIDLGSFGVLKIRVNGIDKVVRTKSNPGTAS